MTPRELLTRSCVSASRPDLADLVTGIECLAILWDPGDEPGACAVVRESALSALSALKQRRASVSAHV